MPPDKVYLISATTAHITVYTPIFDTGYVMVTQVVPASKDLAVQWMSSHSIPVRSAEKVWLPSFLQMRQLKGSDLVEVTPLLGDRPGTYAPGL